MNKRAAMIGTTFGIVLSAAGMTFGQIWHQLVVTPEMKAKFVENYRVGHAMMKAFKAGDYEAAEAYARQSIALEPGFEQPYMCLAQSLNAQGKTQEALKAYKFLADTGSDDPRNLLPYSQLLLKTGHWAQAVAAFNKALPGMSDPIHGSLDALVSSYGHLSPQAPQPRELETALHLALGMTCDRTYDDWGQSQDSKSLLEYARAYALSPTSAVATLFEGRRLWKLHRFTEANAAFAKAAQLGNGQVRAAAQQAMR